MSNLYTSWLSAISGEAADEDSDGYGVFGSVAADAWSLIVASCVLAASVVIWEACAFPAMAATLVAGAAWGLSVVAAAAAGWSPSRAVTGDATAPGGSACGAGLAEVDIRGLPARPYQHHRVGLAGSATCSVCLEEVRGGEMVRSLPECRHAFHVGCIDPWLRSHVTCPLCRSDLWPRRRRSASTDAEEQGPAETP